MQRNVSNYSAGMYDTGEEEFPRACLDKSKKLRAGTKEEKRKIGTLRWKINEQRDEQRDNELQEQPVNKNY